jgi:hypothetical protein
MNVLHIVLFIILNNKMHNENNICFIYLNNTNIANNTQIIKYKSVVC